MTQIITWNINSLHCGGLFIFDHVSPPLRVIFVLLPASIFAMYNGGDMCEFTVKCFTVLDPFMRSGNLLLDPGCILIHFYPDVLQLGDKPGSCQADPRQRSIVVQITDQCPECGPNHMDMQALTWAKVIRHKSLSQITVTNHCRFQEKNDNAVPPPRRCPDVVRRCKIPADMVFMIYIFPLDFD